MQRRVIYYVFLQNSIVDVPVQHTAAIVIDTDSLTCKILMLSKSPRTV